MTANKKSIPSQQTEETIVESSSINVEHNATDQHDSNDDSSETVDEPIGIVVHRKKDYHDDATNTANDKRGTDTNYSSTNDRKMPAQPKTQSLAKTTITTRSPTNNERNINISSQNTEETIVESSIIDEEHKATDQHAFNESCPESNITNSSTITFSEDNNLSIENETENSDSLNIETHH